MCMDGKIYNKEERVSGNSEAVTIEANPESLKAEYDQKLWAMQQDFEYRLSRDVSASKVNGALMRERMERLMRVMFLRETKERLKASGQWSRYCSETGIDIKNADYEIDKLGEFRDDLLLSFSSFCGYDINKIKYLTNGNSEKLGVTVENGEIFVKGEKVPLTPEDVEAVVTSLQEDLRKQEEKAVSDKANLEKQAKESAKSLKKAERELKRLKREASKKGITEEEQAFMEEMDEVRKDFFELIARMNPEDVLGAPDDRKEPTAMQIGAYKSTVEFIRAQVAMLCEAAGV